MRNLDRNQFFEEGSINQILNRYFYKSTAVTLMLGVLFSVVLCYGPVRLLHALDLQLYGFEAIGAYDFASDFSALIQMLLAIPLYLVARKIIMRAWDRMLNHVDSSLLEVANLELFRDRMDRICAWATSKPIEILILIISFLVPVSTFVSEYYGTVQAWYVVGDSDHRIMTFAGLYAWLIAIPVYIFLTFYWIRQIFLWISILFVLSRSDINYDVLNPDGYCGLGFLKEGIKGFSLLIFIQGIVQGTTTLYKVGIQGLSVLDANVLLLIVAYIVFAPLLFLIPLTFFAPKLYKAKDQAIENMRSLIRYHHKETMTYSELERYRSNKEDHEVFKVLQNNRVFLIDLQAVLRLFGPATLSVSPLVIDYLGLRFPIWMEKLVGLIL